MMIDGIVSLFTGRHKWFMFFGVLTVMCMGGIMLIVFFTLLLFLSGVM